MGTILFGLFLGILAVAGYIGYVMYYNNDNEYQIKNNTKTAKKVSKGLVTTALLVPVVLFTLLSTLVQVGTGEIAVMTRFGQVTGEELGEGIHFKNPLDQANIYDVKVQKQETEATAASNDLQDVNAKLVINYHLERGKVSEIHRTVGTDYHDKLIANAVQETFKATSAQFTATQLITERPKAKAEVTAQLSDRLVKYGIIIDNISLNDFSFSPEFTQAIEAKQVAQQEAEKAKYEVEKSRNQAQAAIEQAKGVAESNRLVKESLTPELLQKLTLDITAAAISKWNGAMPQYLASGSSIFNIPLK